MTPISTSKPRHIMQVVHSLTLGGSERLACDLALGLNPSRVRSSICALAIGGPLAERLEEAAVPYYVVNCPPGVQWRVVPRLYQFFRRTQVDVVQTHHIKQLLYSAVGARMAGAALVHVEHEFFTLKPPRIRRRLRLAARLCNRIVVVGHEVKAFLVNEVGLPPSKITVIPNGVDVERYRPRPRLPREALGLPSRERLIGHVARLEPEKDQASLIRAFRLVADAHADTRLVIVGDGSQRGALQRAVAELRLDGRVDFLGLREDVPDLLPHFELFVLPSLSEGLPLAILEAMACERPVVATAIGEIPRVVRQGVTGVTVPPSDPATLAQALIGVLEGPDRAAAMGARARRLVEDAFSLKRVIAQYEVLYDSLDASDGHRPKTLGRLSRVS